ncbi:hypothetical protein SPKIRA_37410 (plasmid) [Sphingomonas paucimobilis]|nr:hypothetical protein SPKIRA_37410 [Sphingomonas paucimobilis]
MTMTSPPSTLPHANLVSAPVFTENSRVRVAYLVPPSPHFAGMERVTHELASELVEHHAGSIAVSVIYFTDYPEVRDAPYRIIRAGRSSA